MTADEIREAREAISSLRSMGPHIEENYPYSSEMIVRLADRLADALEAAETRNRELEAALAVALELLQDAGYDTDPDYRPEWKTMIDAASRAETGKPEDAQAPEGTGS